eukprot:CAMPEP_0198146120 /NCGR_PEP_ID=MMETSP1443-20131203/27526_1 /TAXON_ID=186043 /ORGANISM="Entomoneis sp., Strain CCMP2396" /LENGTH=287 /DNA_ID=CAMNT_0043809961 /DNA_START=99 /DNA_END=962 /DNA_ORIENTATION=-
MSAPLIRVIPNKKLFVSEPDPSWFGNGPNAKNDDTWTNENWLKSRFHFSFAEYNNNNNSDFGILRVMNDDLVQPHRGFGTHPHGNMEIMTYIVHGELTHQDSMGTKESLGRGSVQYMTAGTGVRHSEFNHGDKPLRFIQTWIKPTRGGLAPNYGSYCGDDGKDDRKNKLQHLMSNAAADPSCGDADVGPVQINQDVDGYASELDLDQQIVYELPADRQAYLLCIEGGIEVNGKALEKHDACEIIGSPSDATSVEVKAIATEETEGGPVAHFLMFTMKRDPDSGRRDL